MFRSLILSLVALAMSFVPCLAQSHGTVQYQNIHAAGVTTPRMATFLVAPINGPVGVFMYGQADRNWSEMYAGLTYAPVSWMQVGAGGGTESFANAYRLGTFISIRHLGVSLLVIDEEGQGGRFSKVDGSWTVKTVAFGGYWDNLLGGGAKVAIRLPHTPFSVAGIAQSRGQQVALKYGF